MATGRLSMTYTVPADRPEFRSQEAAQQLYARAAHSTWSDLKMLLLRRSTALQVLKEDTRWSACAGTDASALRTIPLTQIVGSVERARSHDFDDEFRPRSRQVEQRWLSVAARRQAGRSLPPVELVQVDQQYFVVDGHHRVSVERAMGLSTIQAHVTRLCS